MAINPKKTSTDLPKLELDRRQFVGGAAAVVAAAAGSGLTPRPVHAAAKKGGTLRMGKGHGQTSDTLDPDTYENGYMIGLSFTYQGHLTEVAADGSLQPELAENWEASDDAKTWVFKLREGVEFHSGKTLDAEDVIASLNHHRGENSTSAAKPIVEPIKEIRADSSDTVIIELTGSNADFPFILSDYHLCIGPAKDGKVDWSAGDACGAYKIDHFEPGVRTDLVRHTNFWREDRAFFDSIEMLAIPDVTARTNALLSGEIDAMDKVDIKLVERLKRVPTLDVHSVLGTQHYTFAMASNQDPFTDVNIRLALKYAIDRQELVDKILQGYGSVGNDHPIGAGQRFFNTELAQTVHDPDKAKWHLKEAGVDRLAVSLSAADAAFTGAVDAATLFAGSASPAGIDLEVVREPNDGYWSNVWMKKPFCAVFWGGRPIEDQMFSTAYQTGASWNDSFWSNARFDELLVAARGELDEAKRREMYWEMQAILNQDGGVIVPMFASYVFATSNTIGHGDQFGSNWDTDGERWAERWWFA